MKRESGVISSCTDLPGKPDKTIAAVCGLYCRACSLYIATTEEPARLKLLAGKYQISEEEVRCCGCRSEKRGLYCKICKMYDCAAGKGIDFCSECGEYPCEDLKEFQSAMPHRIELFENLETIKEKGFEKWLEDIRENYTCRSCGTMNSAYDLKCRKCGFEPGSDYAAAHRAAIEKHLKNR